MTTITYRDGTLAADTLIAYNSITNGERAKIARAGSFYVALAGPAMLRRALEGWVARGADPDDLPSLLAEHSGKFEAMMVNDAGEVFEYDSGEFIPVVAEYTAIGSGSFLAMGAMAHGASAEEAVIAASRHDKNTGGRIDHFHYTTLAQPATVN